MSQKPNKLLLNPRLHFCGLKHRDQKYFGKVSFWPAEYPNRPPKVPLIFNFKNFGIINFYPRHHLVV